jgi:hypothetical protein
MFVYPFRKSQDELMGPFRENIPLELAPRDPAIVETYYTGGVSFWTADRMSAFLVPFVAWMVWLLLLGVTIWAWNVLLRRRWIEHDRLSFPCCRLPMEICREGGFGGALRTRGFLAGALTAAAISSMSVLNTRYPGIPVVPLGWNATATLDAAPPPWNALSPMILAWGTVEIGICYLIPMEILFSGWVFYLFRKAMEVYGYSMGWRDLGWDAAGFPFTRSVAAGAWIGLFFVLVWSEREHLGRSLRRAFAFRRSPNDDSGEPGSYAWAGRLLILGTALMVAWSVHFGMRIEAALVFYAFFWMLNVTMTRIYAQVGPPILELYFMDPQKTLTTVFGTIGHSPRTLTMFSLMYWYNRTDRGQPMAHQLASWWIAQSSGASLRTVGRWTLVAFLFGCVVCLASYLHYAYKFGEDQFQSGGWRETFSQLAVSRINDWVRTPKGPNWKEIGFMIFGGGFTLGLWKAAFVFPGWALHPVGFALAMCFGLEYIWPVFLGMWIVKGRILRYGGLPLYQSFVPAAMGLTLGGLVTPVLWGFVGWAFEWNK